MKSDDEFDETVRKVVQQILNYRQCKDKDKKQNLFQMKDNSQHIFFVDDEPKIHQVVAEILKQLGIGVTCFSYASDCLEKLSSQKCDLLITDLRMPVMSGMELLIHAKSMAPWLPVLVISGYGDIPIAVEAVKNGAVDFIEKPLDKRSFVQRVKSILSQNCNHNHLSKPLTKSEHRVLRLVFDGKSNREIASLINRSQRTIEVHRANIMNKLGAENLVDLFKRAVVLGLVEEFELRNSYEDDSMQYIEKGTPYSILSS